MFCLWILAKIHNLLAHEDPDFEELLKLSIQHDRQQALKVQQQKDQQVLDILKAKDRELEELQATAEE